MEFLNLEQGDKDNLEGKVVIYTIPNLSNINLNDPAMREMLQDVCPENASEILRKIESGSLVGSNHVVGLYATPDITDMKEKFPEIPNDLEGMIREDMDEETASLLENSKIRSYYCAFFSTSLEGLKDFKNDKINLGDTLGPHNFHKAAIGALQFYIANYHQQRENKSMKPIKRKDSKAQAPIVLYKDLPPQDRLGYMHTKYFSPMIYKLETNNTSEAINLSQDLIVFSQDSVIEDDAYSVATAVNLTNPAHTKFVPELVGNYFGKIVAVTKEDYKGAAQYRDKINELKAQMKER